MKTHQILRGLKFLLFVALAATVFSFAVMWLWNWLMPAVFGLRAITVWQAVGLLFLCKILFGGFRGGGGHDKFWRRRMMERWEQMSPEEREQFRASMRGRCGPFGAPAEPPKA